MTHLTNLCYNARVQYVQQRLGRASLVITACLALGAGLVLARWHALQGAYLIVVLVPLVVLALRRRRTVAALVLLVVLFGAIGWWRGSGYVRQLAVHESLHLQKVTIVGRATDEAVYGKRQQLEFVLTNVEVLDPVRQRLVGNITVRGFGESMVYRGDTVQVSGRLYPTLGNSLASISFAELTVVSRGTSRINALRREFAAGMQSALPEPLASFALGLLIGQRTTLPPATEEQLRQTGLTHIIAVSGYNLTIIVLACRRLLANRSKFQATAACASLVAGFLLLTGSSPPIVRASIISLLAIAAWYYGRQIKPLVLLLTGAAITAVANPLHLWGNASWYLSFLAFYGVLVLAPLVTKRLMGNKEPKVLASIIIESACASICVLPYVLYVFGETSLVSLLANVLVVPLIPLAMLSGLAAGLAGMFAASVVGWFAWPATLLLTYMLDIAALLSRVPHAFMEKIDFPLGAMLASYVMLGIITLLLWHRTKPVRQAGRLEPTGWRNE